MVTWVSVALGRAVWLVCAGSGHAPCVCVRGCGRCACVCVCVCARARVWWEWPTDARCPPKRLSEGVLIGLNTSLPMRSQSFS